MSTHALAMHRANASQPREANLLSRAVLAMLIVFVAQLPSLFVGQPAQAHSQVTGTIPSNGQTVAESPKQVEVVFNETVIGAPDALKVFNSETKRVDKANAKVVNGNQLVLDLDQLSPGGYVMTWRVVSADSHPVRGAVSFQVGSGDVAETKALAERIFNADESSTGAAVGYAVVRFLAFAALAISLGLIVFVALTRSNDATLVRVVHWALGILALAGIGELAFQGLLATDGGFASLLSKDPWQAVFRSHFGWLILIRTVAAILSLAFIDDILRALTKNARQESAKSRTAPMWAVISVIAIAFVVTTMMARHAPSGRLPAVGIVADVVHIAASSLWLGGLLALVITVLRTRGSQAQYDVERKTAVLHHFSTLATACVILIAVSGLVQGWRQIGTFDALFDDTYGILVAIKAVLFGLMIGFASFGRTRIRYELEKDGDVSALKSVRIQTAFEVFVAVAILCVTAVLVSAEPPKQAANGGIGFSTEVPVSNHIAQIVVDPAVAGLNTTHVYVLSTAGAPQGVEQVTLRIALPQKGIEQIELPLREITPDHYVSDNFSIPIADKWQARVTVQSSPTEVSGAEFEMPIG